jgi:hypothetical protein
VHHTVYLGEVAQHQVSLPSAPAGGPDINLRAFEVNPRIVARDAPEPVTVWIAPEDVVVLAD